eukprot:TRINITY_DN3931_c0_g2_i1.p3 TRINITY_DN3931_c0_g2~~TRINITY_DN3931_c0_g2_i1.p3  ORF type:complete len:157 (-),score=19.58 TRINITY_DN3931_c0_g2_i1:422-892(-)
MIQKFAGQHKFLVNLKQKNRLFIASGVAVFKQTMTSSYSRSGGSGTYSVSTGGGMVSSSSSTTTGGGVSMQQNSLGGNNMITTREDENSVRIILQGPGISGQDTDIDIQNRKVRIQGNSQQEFLHETQLPHTAIMDSAQIQRNDGQISITFQKQQV